MARDLLAGMSPPARRRFLAARRRNPRAAAAFDRLPIARRRSILQAYEGPGRRRLERLVLTGRASNHVEHQIEMHGARDIANEPRMDLLTDNQLRVVPRMTWKNISDRAKEKHNFRYGHLGHEAEFTLDAPNPFWYH